MGLPGAAVDPGALDPPAGGHRPPLAAALGPLGVGRDIMGPGADPQGALGSLLAWTIGPARPPPLLSHWLMFQGHPLRCQRFLHRLQYLLLR